MIFIKRDYEEILKRAEEQNIDLTNCHIYLKPNNLNGNYCGNATLSQDGSFICIPVKEYCPETDTDVYVPTCYEIRESFSTYLKGDSLYYLVEGMILYGRK